MANPVDISDYVSDANGRAGISGSVSATCARQGTTVSITITIKITDGWGQYYSVHVNNNNFSLGNKIGTATKTYTYDNPSAKTYSFDTYVYLQTAAQVSGYTYTKGTLTVTVPAAEPTVWKQGTPYIEVNGAWKQGTPYIKVNGAWKQGLLKFKAEGA